MDNEKRILVYNRCKYDIGVTYSSGQQGVVKAGSFLPMTAVDIMYIESICRKRRFFSSKMLVPVVDGKDIPLEDIGVYSDQDSNVHMNDEEIIAGLKKPLKQFEAWLEKIEDPEELHAIYLVGKGMDLPASKLKILKAKAPNKDWLNEDE